MAGRITVGNLDILGLSDAAADYPWPLDELFPSVPQEAWEHYRRRYPSVFGAPNVWHSDFGCYLLRSQGQIILVDTGVGPAGAPAATALRTEGRLLDKIQSAGIRPEEVERVVLTHLHPDHVGWTLVGDSGGRRLTFPHARYVVHEADWSAFHQPEVQQHFPFAFVEETITPLETLGALELITAERSLSAELTLLPTPGHTPGHTSVLIDSAGERAIILGDVALHPAQITEPNWNAMFDMDGDAAAETRLRILERIESEGLTIAACHFPEPGFGRIVRLEGRRYWQGL